MLFCYPSGGRGAGTPRPTKSTPSEGIHEPSVRRSRLYGAQHRVLQDQHDTRRVADKIEELAVHTELGEMDRAFIESRDMFFFSTIDHEGRPTVSYKGGDPGFVRAIVSKTIAFPLFDGNGMFYSAGNVTGNAKVGMLFIDFATPNRMRVQGEASIDPNDPLLMEFVEAQLVVRVKVTEVWPNCPRYVHSSSVHCCRL